MPFELFPPRKKIILEDSVCIDSGIKHSKNASESSTTTVELLRALPIFEANLLSFYMTPTLYKLRFPQNRKFDHCVAYASKILNNSHSGKINVIVSSNSSSPISNPHRMTLTLTPTISSLLLLRSKTFATKSLNFFSNRNTPKISYFEFKNSLLHSLTKRTILSITLF